MIWGLDSGVALTYWYTKVSGVHIMHLHAGHPVRAYALAAAIALRTFVSGEYCGSPQALASVGVRSERERCGCCCCSHRQCSCALWAARRRRRIALTENPVGPVAHGGSCVARCLLTRTCLLNSLASTYTTAAAVSTILPVRCGIQFMSITTYSIRYGACTCSDNVVVVVVAGGLMRSRSTCT
jgi:hypothetical protein